MTPEKQRIAIAEACGWTDIERRDCGADKSDFDWSGRPISSGYPWTRLPNYLNDLNAIHEAEKTLDVMGGGPKSADCPRYAYSNELYKLVPEWQQPFRATAAQRCEAFLRTIGKWEDHK